MNEVLTILERAISDVGHWRWWVRSDTAFQVEFGWVMLLIPSEDASRPPSSTIALRFHEPRCVAALRRATEGSSLPDDWFAKLGRDEIEPLGVNDGELTLTDLGQLRSICQEASCRDFILGDERIELCKNRSFVITRKDNGDLWPFDDQFEEPIV